MEEVAEQSPTSDSMATTTFERFIPIDRNEIFDKLLTTGIWSPAEQDDARTVLSYISRVRQQDSCANLDELAHLYDPFNPDDETVNRGGNTAEDKSAKMKTFLTHFTALVEGANYTSISERQLEKILGESSPEGVEVDLDLTEFEFTLLFFRGQTRETRSRRDWDTFFLKKEYDVELYRRFIMALKLKDEDKRIKEIMARSKKPITEEQAQKRLKRLRANLPQGATSDKIYIKVFKYIPQNDLEMLFPNTKVKLRYWDKVRLWITAGGSTAAGIFGAATKILATALLSPLLLAMSIFGLAGVIFRQVMNLINTRNKYMMELAQKLYFHNLANNQSVIAALIDEAEEENIKEELLLYTSLLKGPLTPGQLQRAKADIEGFLRHHWDVEVHFDVHDALKRLREDGLVTDEAGLYRAKPLAEAKSYLTYRWTMALEGKPVPPQRAVA